LARGNPHPHRYKYGKVEKPITFDILKQFMARVEKIDRFGLSVSFVQALLATGWWTGFRSSEVVGDSQGRKWKVRDPNDKSGLSKLTRHSEPFPGLLKENMWVDETHMYILQEARKHGHREDPVALSLSAPYVNLIVERWKETKPGERLFPIDEVRCWYLLKRIDPKLYWHLFCLTRVTKLCEDKRNSLADVVRFTGKSPVTIGWYMSRVGRDAKEIGDRMVDQALAEGSS
jgi:hypothetical protein